MRSHVTSAEPIRGKVNLMPLMRIAVSRCDDSVVKGHESFIGTVSPLKLCPHLAVPVTKKSFKKTHLFQVIDSGWDRQLNPDIGFTESSFYPPPLLSTRHNWVWDRDAHVLEILERAYVIDGAKRLETAITQNNVTSIPIMIVAGLNPDDELELRQRQLAKTGGPTKETIVERIGTETPRLKIDDCAVDLEIETDPFVVHTTFGYSSVIIVQRESCVVPEHIHVSAKSLGELEDLRVRFGTLKGLRIRIRKIGQEKSAPYFLELLGT